MKWWQYMIAGAVAVVLLILAFWAGRKVGQADPQTVIERDTVVVVRVDTVTRDRPVYVESRVVDTMLVAVSDTVVLRDSVYVEVAREQVEYRDSLYRAWVSGYKPALDSIAIYQRTQVVEVQTVVERPVVRRWGVGITAGYGATLVGGKVQGVPYVGVGVSYNLFSW